MKSTLLISISACLLGGCSSLFPTEQQDAQDSEWLDSSLQTQSYQNEQNNPPPPLTSVDTSVNFHNQLQERLGNNQQTTVQLEHTRKPQENSKNINYYVRGLMQDLVGNLQYVNNTTPVAVSSFVMLDSDYNDSNLLGIQIAESLIHEVHKFGIPVIDFKATGYIRITEQGDFAFSKDYQDFSGEMAARYIVGGTMLKHTHGYLINARIVGVQSQAVVASAQSFIPDDVASAIIQSPAPAVADDEPEQAPLVSIIQG